jgi:hypothetical protein
MAIPRYGPSRPPYIPDLKSVNNFQSNPSLINVTEIQIYAIALVSFPKDLSKYLSYLKYTDLCT